MSNDEDIDQIVYNSTDRNSDSTKHLFIAREITRENCMKMARNLHKNSPILAI